MKSEQAQGSEQGRQINEAELAGQVVEEEEWAEEDDEDFDDFIDDELWFDGHEGGGGNFTKTYKATIAGNRPNSSATQFAAAKRAVLASKNAAGGGVGGKAGGGSDAQVMKKFQPAAVRHAKIDARINVSCAPSYPVPACRHKIACQG